MADIDPNSYTVKEMLGKVIEKQDRLDDKLSRFEDRIDEHLVQAESRFSRLEAIESVALRVRRKVENGGDGIEHRVGILWNDRSRRKWVIALAIGVPSAIASTLGILEVLNII